ncbi:hypothetical protein NQ315_006457 [Exocentrus adspersus]|uniref:FGFR1 oncogene partner (FOP) N-terminal dimerisation domain-containing protein n=1 Tax=Exocentrus adspersus TaxID=1586481 RepID=A0AAV8W041_9CUCU|nr:hypothetical protein NQ315_006457 [Exocentrus adspersus]
MSVEEDIELKDLVAQTLETNGCLAKIRAQLRASIFLALDEDVQISKKQPLLNNKLKTHLETEEGKLMFNVVREFLEFFNLYFTLSVFDPESYLGSGYVYEGREKIAKDLGLDDTEHTTVPLLLELIKIAQTKTNSLDIHLNLHNVDTENKSVTHENSTNDLNKTDSDNRASDATNVNGGSGRLLIENSSPVPERLNATFDVTSPTVDIHPINKTEISTKEQLELVDRSKDRLLDSTYSKKDENDDTYGDTSSIAEDSVAANGENSLIAPELVLNGTQENDADVSQPILKESKPTDKLKLPSQKPEKLKSKNSLSTLSDLPPLQMKSRVNDILPSLYSKEFKDKSNLRELDKLFDMEAEYEEDFDDLSLKSDYFKSDQLKTGLLEVVGTDKLAASKKDSKPKILNKILSDCNKPFYKPLVSGSKIKDACVSVDGLNKSEGDSSTSVNEKLSNNSAG